MKGANNSYFGNISEAVNTSLSGLKITLRHLKNAILKTSRKGLSVSHETYFEKAFGIETLSYPHEQLPIPDNGRYKLHNEIDDCIVCDKCAKICPVDCIEIEPIKSNEVFGYTSDGTGKRLYAATFNIDMAKCCFCGLCTTVCPTECLTMTKEYDFSEFEVSKMNYAFAELSPEEAEAKRQEYQQSQQAKMQKTLAEPASPITSEEQTEQSTQNQEVTPKPKFVPKMKPAAKTPEASAAEAPKEEIIPENEAQPAASKPKFVPKMKPVIKKDQTTDEDKKD